MKMVTVSVVAIVVLLVLFIVGGIPALSSIGSFIAGMKNDNAPPAPSEDVFVLEPILDPPPTATNTATINITGTGTTGSTILLYVNGSKTEETLVGREGNFTIPKVRLTKGDNIIYAITKIDNDTSEKSREFTVLYSNEPPKLEITSPSEPSITTQEEDITIEGDTDSDVEVYINDRFVYVSPGGHFNSTYKLNEGENTITVTATDAVGNSTKTEFKVTYEKLD